MSSKSYRGSYAPKRGNSGNKGHKIGPGQHETSVIATKQRLGRQTGTGRRGFPHLPPEGAPSPGDAWRG